jgi:hypothetical protein
LELQLAPQSKTSLDLNIDEDYTSLTFDHIRGVACLGTAR